MGTGRRTSKVEEGRKLNIAKVLIVLIILLILIAGIILLVKNIKFKNDNLENKKEELQNSLEEKDLPKTIDEIAEEFGGEIKEKIKRDTYYVIKDEKEYTIYEDGEIIAGRVVMWDGTSQMPAIDEAGNINIYNPAELRWIAEQVSNGEKSFAGVTITLRNSLDFGARKNTDGIWEGIKWTPIIGFLDNTQTENAETLPDEENTEITEEHLKRFAGTFIGNGCSIRGLYIDTSNRYAGLFGYQTGIITGINLKNSYIKGEDSVGSIVGLNGGTIQNTSIQNVEVVGSQKVGGIAGTSMTSSVIEDCKTEGTIIGDRYIGGISGYINNNANIFRVINNANISGNQYVGGIAGISFYATVIKDATNYAQKIVGSQFVGGLIGYSQSQIENSSNQSAGTVEAKNYVGGLVGANYVMGNITDCFNSSKVITTEDNCGGIAGINNANISNCYNTGEIDSLEADGTKIGGICGQNVSDSYIYTSYNIGKINAKSIAGGVVGADFGTISNCYYLDSVSKQLANEDCAKDEENMKNTILESLGQNYKSDLENKNSGYPILLWQ